MGITFCVSHDIIIVSSFCLFFFFFLNFLLVAVVLFLFLGYRGDGLKVTGDLFVLGVIESPTINGLHEKRMTEGEGRLDLSFYSPELAQKKKNISGF